MKKMIVWSILSAFIIGIIVGVASLILSFSYVAWGWIIGLGLSVIIFFFNSSGGPSSTMANFEASEVSGKIQEDNEIKANVGVFFYGSVLFTIISLTVMVISYY